MQTIPQIHRELAKCQATLHRINQSISKREVEIKAGVDLSGCKNAEERSQAFVRSATKDATLTGLCQERDNLTEQEILLKGELEALAAERRAEEWRIRSKLADALLGGGVQANHRGGHEVAGPSDMAFDDALDHAVNEIWGEPVFINGASDFNPDDLGF